MNNARQNECLDNRADPDKLLLIPLGNLLATLMNNSIPMPHSSALQTIKQNKVCTGTTALGTMNYKHHIYFPTKILNLSKKISCVHRLYMSM